METDRYFPVGNAHSPGDIYWLDFVHCKDLRISREGVSESLPRQSNLNHNQVVGNLLNHGIGSVLVLLDPVSATTAVANSDRR
jgi:hypothetical protein